MRRRFVIAMAALAFLTLGAAKVQASMIFADNFNAGPSPLWGDEVGNWTTSGGAYFAQSPNNNPATYSGLPFILQDFSIDVDINQLQDGGVWLRSADNQNGVLLVTGGHLGTGTGLYWHVVTDGAFSAPVDEVDGLFTPGVSDANIRVVVSGDTYSAFVDGSSVPATTLTTSAFASGRVGLYDFSNQTFDNVVVATPDVAAAPEPSTLALLGTCAISLLGYRWWRRKRSVLA